VVVAACSSGCHTGLDFGSTDFTAGVELVVHTGVELLEVEVVVATTTLDEVVVVASSVTEVEVH